VTNTRVTDARVVATACVVAAACIVANVCVVAAASAVVAATIVGRGVVAGAAHPARTEHASEQEDCERAAFGHHVDKLLTSPEKKERHAAPLRGVLDGLRNATDVVSLRRTARRQSRIEFPREA
jgi:hypothetical protein